MRALCLLILCLPLATKGQFTYSLDHSIPVSNQSGDALDLAWLGGINAAQINKMDLDGDGVEDLVIFDRMANKIITLRAEGTRYVPAPEYESLFPEGVTNWLLLRDYNCDGRKDIFTGDAAGIKVYTNVSTSDHLQWEPYLFETGFEDSYSHVVLTENPATEIKVNVQLQYDDMPTVADIDGDGDLDILNIQYLGHTIEFHRNMRVENDLPCDVMEFRRETQSWGSVRECECGVFAFNGQGCPPHAGRTEHAGGKSLFVGDLNGDDAPDILISEADCTRLYAMFNEGTAHAPVFNSFSLFPANQPVNFFIFPAAFYEDVDFDGVKDLIASPNLFSKEYLNTLFDRSVWFYKNTGTSSEPTFSLVRQNFLQNEMIDVGDNAVPALIDIDGDGDDDLLISSNSSTTFISRIVLFENIGSSAAPAFRLTDDDFLGFSQSRYYNLKIQFIDFDGNGTTDLLFTGTNLDTRATHLYFLSNNSRSHLDFSKSIPAQVPFALTYSENLHIVDLNGDGLPDILAGRSEGNLEYWRNTGVAGTPAFILEVENYLGFDSSPLRQNLTASVADLDSDGLADLIVGDNNGTLTIISGFLENPASVTDIIYNPITSTHTPKNLGGQVWTTVANLFNATRPVIVVGNGLGGVHILRHDEGVTLPEDPVISVYPNPVSARGVINIEVDRTCTMEVLSIIGQQVSDPILVRPYRPNTFTPSLPPGIYIMKFTASRKTYTRRFVVH